MDFRSLDGIYGILIVLFWCPFISIDRVDKKVKYPIEQDTIDKA